MNPEILRVLLATGDATDRLLFSHAFNEIDIPTEVVIVHNGAQLMDYLTANADRFPQLLLLDGAIAQQNGLCYLRELKANAKYSGIAIAVYSTSATEKDIEENFICGANIYIHKPVDFPSLKTVLKKAVFATSNYQLPPFNKANFLLRL